MHAYRNNLSFLKTWCFMSRRCSCTWKCRLLHSAV